MTSGADTETVRTVVILAVGAALALAVALITGSTAAAVAVVGMAAGGIVLLLRDWRADRDRPAAAPAAAAPSRPDEFAPDISDRPDGPSSDARADQV